ncbi:MAG: hypothetical protein ABR999_07140 [Methanoregula sp.]|uniref:hypothetical protein n=1 Tax=Methanoregula sp. TaxID=2052170 RepID=UPI003D0BB117
MQCRSWIVPMGDEWQPEAVIRLRLEHLKKEFIDYIDVNIEKIDTNIPVFMGHVITSLDKTLPDLSNEFYDHFIDAMAFAVLAKSKRSDDIPFVEKLFEYALHAKRGNRGRAVYDILLGMKMINIGKYAEAAEQLKKYRSVDAIICPAIAYCYFVLSTQKTPVESRGESQRPNEMSLAAREQMIELVRLNPPINRLQDLEIAEDPRINKIFWFMIKQVIDWFPGEREFIRIGIEKASRDGKRDIKEELLNIAIERFYNDMFFLRELYTLKLENRDAGGVAGVVKQMIQQYPDNVEPIYYGLKLSIITSRMDTYFRFRKLAVKKNIPAQALPLLDYSFEVMCDKQVEAAACMDEIKKRFGPQHYFVTLLEYVAHDFHSDDTKKVKHAKKAMFDAIDQYCIKLIKIKAR